jgi:hypothetical protein
VSSRRISPTRSASVAAVWLFTIPMVDHLIIKPWDGTGSNLSQIDSHKP